MSLRPLIFPVLATLLAAQAPPPRRVTLSVREADLKDVLRAATEGTDINLSFDPGIDTRIKGLDLKAVTLDELLDQVLPNLRFPKLGLPLKWDDSGKGYFLEIDYGLGPDESNIELDLCTVGEFRITPKEGGTVEIKYRVQVSGSPLTEKVCGKLASLIQQEVKIMLTPPKAAAAGDEPDEQLPTNPDAVSKALFGDQGGEDGGDAPVAAMKRAHGISETA